MTKAELIKKLAQLPDDAQIHFALFDDNNFKWRLLGLNAQFPNDPADTIGLTTTPIKYNTLAEVSTVKH